jgi:hypothetical protein
VGIGRSARAGAVPRRAAAVKYIRADILIQPPVRPYLRLTPVPGARLLMYSVVYGRVRPGASPATVVHLEILRSQSRPNESRLPAPRHSSTRPEPVRDASWSSPDRARSAPGRPRRRRASAGTAGQFLGLSVTVYSAAPRAKVSHTYTGGCGATAPCTR